MKLPGISSPLPFNMSRVFNAFLALSSAILTWKEVEFACSKSNRLMGTDPTRRIPGSQK
jgi:hypothetical protein